MEQDIPAAIKKAQEAMRVIPLDGPANRASAFDVRFDGGAFTLHVYDVREAPGPRSVGLIEKWETVEIGRFALSPQALSRLMQSCAIGEAAYGAVIGRPVPSDAEMTQNVTTYMTNAAKTQQVQTKKR